jgi:hypothetical protein
MFGRPVALLAGIAVAISLVFAQGFTATITGTVKDESGSRLTGGDGHGQTYGDRLDARCGDGC